LNSSKKSRRNDWGIGERRKRVHRKKNLGQHGSCKSASTGEVGDFGKTIRVEKTRAIKRPPKKEKK